MVRAIPVATVLTKTWPCLFTDAMGRFVLHRSPLALALLIGFVAHVSACGTQPVTPAASPEAPVESPREPPASLPKGHVWRHQLMQIMSPGLGAFLQRVEVKEKLVDGTFHGFQLMALLGDPTFWAASELHVGDIITRVNNAPIGHHDEAFRVWKSLLTTNEIVVNYERNGQPQQLRIVVHEDDEPPPASTDR